ncbi:MAG: hypothetical protein AAFO73_12460 [Pseudomonadota bacterium]
MKTLATTLLISAFAVAPAMACGFGKMADHKTPAATASAAPVQDQVQEQAMSTFDPEKAPAFEATTKADETKDAAKVVEKIAE